MSKGYRMLDLPIDDSTLVDLEGLTKDDIIKALRDGGLTGYATRVINRLHNQQHGRKAKLIKAFQLTGTGFEPMAEIDINVEEFAAHGQITNAVDIGNADSIAITILGDDHRETTYLVGREDPVSVWPKVHRAGQRHAIAPAPDYDKPVVHGYLHAEYIASNLNTFFGKRMAIKFKGTGVLQAVEVFADDLDAYHFDLGGTVCRVTKNDLVDVYKEAKPGILRPGPYPWGGNAPVPGRNPFDSPMSRAPKVVRKVERGIDAAELREAARRRTMRRPTAPRPSSIGPSFARFVDAMTIANDHPDYTVTAYSVAVRTDVEYRGMKISLRGDKIQGVLTDFHLDSEGKVVFVIDGQLYKRNYGDVVRLWKKEN